MDSKANRKGKDPDKLLDKVKSWQSSPYVTPLTCRKCESKEKLEPKKQDRKIVLVCPKCRWVQPYVPKPVMNHSIDFPEIVKRNADKNSSWLVGALRNGVWKVKN